MVVSGVQLKLKAITVERTFKKMPRACVAAAPELGAFFFFFFSFFFLSRGFCSGLWCVSSGREGTAVSRARGVW